MYHSIGDATYWFEIHGDGEPLIMLHGFTGSSQTWQNFISNWQKEIRIITVDLPGHGKTEAPNIKTMEDACHDLHQLFSHLKLESFHLLGYSMGGRTALSYAMLYPGKIKSLILESASPGLISEKERVKRRTKDGKIAERIKNEGMKCFVDFWENIPLFESQKNLSAERKAAIREERMSQTEDGLVQSLSAMGTGSQPSWWDDLEGLNVRTLLLSGVLDEKFTGINKSMHECISDSEWKIIENAGHAIHVEQPEIFDKIVREFIFQNNGYIQGGVK